MGRWRQGDIHVTKGSGLWESTTALDWSLKEIWCYWV